MLDIPIEIGNAKDKGGGLYNIVENKIILDKNIDKNNYSDILNHEWSHWLDTQSTQPLNILGTSGFMKVPEEKILKLPTQIQEKFRKYFDPISKPGTSQFTTEVGPRLTQLLNYAGIKDGNKILSWKEWEEIINAYIKEHPHNMNILKESIKDERLFTKWAETNSK